MAVDYKRKGDGINFSILQQDIEKIRKINPHWGYALFHIMDSTLFLP